MQRQQTGRIAGTILALLGMVAASVWAQKGDTPIIILDGSLHMRSAVPWGQFKGTGDMRSHPQSDKSVTSVEVMVGGKNQTIGFSGQQCTVDITYGGTNIKFDTGRDGKGLNFSPFSAFGSPQGSDPLAHRNQNAKISHVTVTKAGTKAFDSDASGGTQITIHYQ